MAATVLIREWNVNDTAQATDKTGGTIRFKDANNATVDLNNPIVRPTSGTVYSYEKYLKLKITVAPAGSITNLRCYSDGTNSFGTGIGMHIGNTASWGTPVKTESSVAIDQAANDFFAKTSGSPLSFGAGPYSSIGDIGDFVVMQASVASTASPGLTVSELLTTAWDET